MLLSDANNKKVIKKKKTDGKEHVRQTEWEEGPQLRDGKIILMSQWLHRLNHTRYRGKNTISPAESGNRVNISSCT